MMLQRLFGGRMQAIEFTILFGVLPVALYLSASRLGIYLTLWGAGLYALIGLWRQPRFSWQAVWHGEGWREAPRRRALFRFLFLAAVLAALTLFLMPERFFRFPLERFTLWLAVMVLYPLLSIIPQEIFFRSYYFARFGGAVARGWSGMLANGLVFGLSHIVLNNWVAPSCCALAGTLWAISYQQHRSLKWAVIEHSLYGCWVFTVGIGWYFFTGNWRS